LYGTEDGFDECAEVDTIMHADVIEEIRECCTGFESGDGIDFSADQDREPEQLIAVADGRIGEVAVEKLIATVGAKAERAAERKLLEEACGVTEAGAERCAAKMEPLAEMGRNCEPLSFSCSNEWAAPGE